MTTYLLDANVLIALIAREHVHHERVSRWATAVDSFATCPIVEGALVRFAVRLGASAMEAQQSLRLVRERRGYEFWPEALPYSDADLRGVHGHRQVTAAYLAALAAKRPGSLLATLDEGLVQARPKVTFRVPELR